MSLKVRMTDGLADLERDLRAQPAKVARDGMAALRRGAMTGNQIAKAHAKTTARKHGKHYPRSFSWDSPRANGAGGFAEYGPVSAKPQGDMSFEEGSRNQPPHGDLEASRRPAAAVVATELRQAMPGWFW